MPNSKFQQPFKRPINHVPEIGVQMTFIGFVHKAFLKMIYYVIRQITWSNFAGWNLLGEDLTCLKIPNWND